MQIEEARPPYISFEVRAVEDRDASIAAGQFKTKDQDFVLITPQGSKDRIERIATEWFESLEQQVQQGRMPGEWLRQFRGGYAAWKEGRELPLEGTPILTWVVLSPSQAKSCIDAHVRTVEDLAKANEETLGRIGMGARALKDKAVSWMTASKGPGKTVEEIADLRAKLSDANSRNDALAVQVKTLMDQVAALAAK